MANSVRWDLVADPSRFNRGFRDAERTSTRFGTRFSASIGRMAGVGLRAFGGLGVAAAGLGIAAGVMGVKTAAANEQAEIAFTSLLKSGTKARRFLDDLKKFAASTPFELPGLIDSAQLLLGVGVEAKKVIPTLRSFGDAAGALGIQQDRFKNIMLATSQAISAGRFQTEDLNQIVENGIPAWKLLSEATGKPVPKLRELASQGKLLSEDVLPLLTTEMNKDFGGSMAKQSQTLTGLWSTLMDTISQGLANVIAPLKGELSSGLTGAIGLTQGALQGAASFITDTVIPALQTLKQWWGDNKDAVATIGTALKDTFTPAAEGAATAVDGLSTSTSDLKDQFTSVAEFAANVVKWWIETRIQTTELMSATYSFITAIGHTINALDRLSGGTGHAGDSLVRFGEHGKQVAERDLAKLEGAARDVQDAIDEMHGKKLRFSGEDHVSSVIDGIIQGIHRLPSGVTIGFQAISRPGHPAAFQHGGRPPVGIASIVGERGPELFVPDRPGTIIPSSRHGGGAMGIDYGRLADAIVAAMQRAGVGQVVMDGRRLDRALATAGISNTRLR